MTGFDAMVAEARRLSFAVQLGPPASAVPDVLCGAPIDAELAALLRQHDGARLRGHPFAVFVRGIAGPESIEWSNRGLRAIEDVAFPFHDLVAFAQVGYQASYLACLPAHADRMGRQPVVYLDTHDTPSAVPLAASIDGAFASIARYLAQARVADDLIDLVFPDAVIEDDPWRGVSDAAHAWIRSLSR